MADDLPYVPLEIPQYEGSRPFSMIDSSPPPKVTELKRANQPNTEPRQLWFQDQLRKISSSLNSAKIPWRFKTTSEELQLDKGAVGHAIANGVLVRPSDDLALDYVELSKSQGPDTLNNSGNKLGRVWLRAFWGFRPDEGGYLGFTNEGNRTRFIEEYRDGDFVLIYGADQQQTAPDQRRQLLGFLQITPIPILDTDRSSETEQALKNRNGWQDRWTYAVPVTRAWRINQRIEAHHLARHTFETKNPILIASRCELLTSEEAEAAFHLRVTPANVYGEPPLPLEQTVLNTSLRTLFVPSKGVAPSHGERNFTVEDSENTLYVLTLEGDVAAFLGRQKFEVGRKMIVKVGHAKEAQVRCDTHNAHLPPASVFKWKVALVSRPFAGGKEAKAAEDALKSELARRYESLGREFFLVDEDSVMSEFSKHARAGSFFRSPG